MLTHIFIVIYQQSIYLIIGTLMIQIKIYLRISTCIIHMSKKQQANLFLKLFLASEPPQSSTCHSLARFYMNIKLMISLCNVKVLGFLILKSYHSYDILYIYYISSHLLECSLCYLVYFVLVFSLSHALYFYLLHVFPYFFALYVFLRNMRYVLKD